MKGFLWPLVWTGQSSLKSLILNTFNKAFANNEAPSPLSGGTAAAGRWRGLAAVICYFLLDFYSTFLKCRQSLLPDNTKMNAFYFIWQEWVLLLLKRTVPDFAGLFGSYNICLWARKVISVTDWLCLPQPGVTSVQNCGSSRAFLTTISVGTIILNKFS